MWYEARKREKATQKLFNDHKKRAEKRREENRIDPHSLLQVNGIKSKLCLDPNVYKQAIKSLVAWQGDKNVSIDRFDVRGTLTSIPHEKQPAGKSILDVNESDSLKSLLNYERFRLLIKNDINKTPEQLRLKLISQGDVLTGAHLKKLQYDSFGAYSDLSKPSNQLFTSSHPRETSRKERPGSFNYSAVSPPECLSSKKEPPQIDSHQDQQRPNVVIDLDEIEDGDDLDAINIARYDTKILDEIVPKYGMTGKEFVLLVKRDKDETSVNNLLKELEDIKNESRKIAANKNNEVYGPILPPDLQLETGSPASPSASSNNDSPIQQRSPSGSSIPLRNERKSKYSDDESQATRRLELSPAPPSQVELRDIDPCFSRKASALDKDVSENYSETSPRNEATQASVNLKTSRSRPRDRDSLPPRRASTPLAYKRNRRSSRSISRERRATSSSRHHSSHTSRRRKRRRSSSSSGSSY